MRWWVQVTTLVPFHHPYHRTGCLQGLHSLLLPPLCHRGGGPEPQAPPPNSEYLSVCSATKATLYLVGYLYLFVWLQAIRERGLQLQEGLRLLQEYSRFMRRTQPWRWPGGCKGWGGILNLIRYPLIRFSTHWLWPPLHIPWYLLFILFLASRSQRKGLAIGLGRRRWRRGPSSHQPWQMPN